MLYKEATFVVQGAAMKKARQDLKLRADYVAKKLEVRLTTIRRWESGVNAPAHRFWPGIKKILGVDVGTFTLRARRLAMPVVNISIKRLTRDMPDRENYPYEWDRYLLILARRRVAEAYHKKYHAGSIPEFHMIFQEYVHDSKNGSTTYQYFWEYDWGKYLDKQGIRASIVLKDEDETKDFFYDEED